MDSLLSTYSEKLVRDYGGHLSGYNMRPAEVYLGEVDFFIKEAEKSGGPVLELACCGGRMSVIMAQAGFEVYAIDSSIHALRLAKDVLALNLRGEEIRRVHLIQGDMCNFYFRRKFPLVIIPFQSFWFNFSRAARAESSHGEANPDIVYGLAERCLKSILGSLQKKGKFIIDAPHNHNQEEPWWNIMSKAHGFSYGTICPYKSECYRVLVGEKL